MGKAFDMPDSLAVNRALLPAEPGKLLAAFLAGLAAAGA